jgi:molecular chaperone HscB
MQCVSCHEPAGQGLICQACGAILPPRRVDPFSALGVPPRFDLTADELEARFRELSRKLHPDRFAKAPARERMLSLQASTTLNDSYRLLKQPLARAQALLALDGVTIGENDKVGGEFLMEMMELGEAIHDAKAEGDAGALERAMSAVQARRDDAMNDIIRLFADNGERAAIKDRLIAIRYFDRLLEAGEVRPAAEVM